MRLSRLILYIHQIYIIVFLIRSGIVLGAEYKVGQGGQQCSCLYKDVCSVSRWNDFVSKTKIKA